MSLLDLSIPPLQQGKNKVQDQLKYTISVQQQKGSFCFRILSGNRISGPERSPLSRRSIFQTRCTIYRFSNCCLSTIKKKRVSARRSRAGQSRVVRPQRQTTETRAPLLEKKKKKRKKIYNACCVVNACLCQH